MADYEDPGWRHTFKSLIPIAGPIIVRRSRQGTNALLSLRMIWVGIFSSLFLIGFVLFFVIEPSRRFKTDQASWFPAVVAILGVVTVAVIRRHRSRPLDCQSVSSLIVSYRVRFLIDHGFAQAPALAAFVGSFLMGTWWIYLLGLAFSLSAMLLVAPTRREIDRRQEQIAAQGSSLSLGRALMGTTAQK
jgi:hypothetical protein